MTKKRFTGGSYGVYDNYKEDRLLWSEWEEVTGIMNNLDLKARERGKALSKLHKENEQLKKELHKLKLVNEMLSMDFSISEHELWRENEELKKELFEARKDYILETYADNPVRRDEKLKELRKEDNEE